MAAYLSFFQPSHQNGANLSSTLDRSPSSYAVEVVLKPVRGLDDTRQFAVDPRKPVFIGRASKAQEKHLSPQLDNALFDCPVVSREHCMLSVHPWAPDQDKVTILDQGSMHGTKVNGKKLSIGRHMSLRNGDRIKLGEQVTRGSITHQPIELEFYRVPGDVSQVSQSQPPLPSGFRVDVPEASDYDSEDMTDEEGYDNISIISDEDNMPAKSSQDTTPEQHKAKLGSQENPIRLHSLMSPIVDLTGDEHNKPSSPSLPAMSVTSRKPQSATNSQPPVFDSHKVIQNTFDQNDSLQHPINLFDQARVQAEVANHASKPSALISPEENDDETSSESTGSEDRALAEAMDADSEIAEEMDDYPPPDDDVLSNDEDGEPYNSIHGLLDDEVDDLYDSSECGAEFDAMHEDEEKELDEDSVYEPEADASMPLKEPSPELGSDIEYIPQSASAKSTTLEKFVDDFGSRRSGGLAPTGTFLEPFNTPYDNQPAPRKSRWDQPADGSRSHDPLPLPRLQPPLADYNPPPPALPHLPAHGYYAFHDRFMQSLGAPSAPQCSTPFCAQVDQRQGPAPGDYGLSNRPLPKTSASEQSKKDVKNTKGKLSIDKLVEPENTPYSQKKNSPEPGTKRKADEISNGEGDGLQMMGEHPDVVDTPAEKDETIHIQTPELLAAATSTQKEADNASEEPSSRRRKIALEDDVSTGASVEASASAIIRAAHPRPVSTGLRTVAKMAGSAVLGGVAAIAFLSSEWAKFAD